MYIGRNGGHLTPNPFRDFCKVAAQYGTAQAIRWLAVEHHTASEIVKFLDSEGLGDEVDLVAGGHIGMLLTEQEVKIAEDDYNAAKEAGVGLENVEWLSKEHMESVSGSNEIV
jgi:hypothetical protein